VSKPWSFLTSAEAFEQCVVLWLVGGGRSIPLSKPSGWPEKQVRPYQWSSPEFVAKVQLRSKISCGIWDGFTRRGRRAAYDRSR